MELEEKKVGAIKRGFEGTRFEQSPKWVRVRFGGRFIADTRRAHLLYEPGRLPVYYFPVADVAAGALVQSSKRDGSRTFYDVAVDAARAEAAAWSVEGRPDFVAFRWSAMDAWFEEDEEVFVHAKDPYHRIDVNRSTRHVRVELGGETIADSHRPVILFETGLPPRYYLPPTDVRLELLEHSETRTQCPYKGEADHWTATIDGKRYEDIAWSYKVALPEVAKIAGLICFYEERVDVFEIDGEVQSKPETPWSKSVTS
jgi:uncharacterized protein (DUF427 family)